MSTADDSKCVDLAYQMAFDKMMHDYRRDAEIFCGKRTINCMLLADLEFLTEAQEDISEMLRAGETYEQIKVVVMPQFEAREDYKEVAEEYSSRTAEDFFQYGDCA